jgi:hypothetical protein
LIQRIGLKKILFLYLLLSSLAYSRPVTAPGMFIGIPYGKPFPSGKYFSTMPAFISIPSTSDNPSTNVAFNVTTLSYVPDFKILNATPIVGTCIPQAFYRDDGKHAWVGNMYNTDAIAGLAWLLNPHLGFSNILAVYAPMNTQGLATNAWVFNERASLTYFDKNSQGTVHFLYGIPEASRTPFKPSLPYYLNLDFTYVRLFNKLSIGPIAFGSWDTTKAEPWSQFAVGGIIGYDFGKFSLQFWLAKDTNANHWGNYASSGFLRLLVPFDNEKPVNIKKTFEI